MALVVFSQSGTTQIRVTGGATAGTLTGTRWVVGLGWKSSLTSKNSLINLTDLTSGGSVIVDGTKMSYDANTIILKEPVKADGLKLSMPASIVGVIYCAVRGW